MACFLIPSALAVVTTAFRRKISTRYHIGWLNTMLWGGTLALAFEHISHEEIVAYPPFLSGLSSTADAASILSEMATVGFAMVIVCVAAWGAMVAMYNRYAQASVETTKTAQAS